MKEYCGIFGIYGHSEASNIAYLGLHALQHRGQESAGIASSDGKDLYSYKQMGLVVDVFNDEILKGLKGANAIGHVRYSTTGASELANAQPFVVKYSLGKIAVAHNGNLVNAHAIRDRLESYGSIFQSTMDTEVIIHLLAQSRKDYLIDRLIEALSQIKGSYSLLFLTENRMVAVRDPMGFRPLSLGRLKDAYVVASETCAFDLIEAEYIRDIEPGEIIDFTENGMESYRHFDRERLAHCIFEYIYFARPDSNLFGRNVYMVRKELGRQLAREQLPKADIVIPVPDSGMPASIGYAEESGLPFELGLIRSHYIGRTFIEPSESIRHFGVKLKLNPVKKILKGKRVVVIDDSIVRGTTSRKIIKMLRDGGAKEVHLRISSPKITHSCFYGIDTPTRNELIGSSHSVEEVSKFITADSLGYMSIKGLLGVVKENPQDFCIACFSGNYPIEFPELEEKMQLGLFEKENK